MTQVQDHPESSTAPRMHGRPRVLRHDRLGLSIIGIVLALALGCAFLWWSADQDLRVARAQTVGLTGQVRDLKQQVADAQNQQSELREELSDSQQQNDGANARLKSRERALERRDGELDQREADLAAQQAGSLTDEGLSSSDADASESLTETDTAEEVNPTDEFDRAWLLSKAHDATEDIRTLDIYMRDGIGVATQLSMLSDSFERMTQAGVPPGLDKPTYLARLSTLQNFAADASEVYYDNPSEAAAKYSVIRKETGVLFSQINKALGTDLRLP